MDTTTQTVHGVLAGAYKGKDIAARTLLRHISIDGGRTAICRKVKADMLCDMEESEPATCPTCLARAAKLARR